MSQYLEQAETFDRIIRLTDKEKKMPMGVIARFFSDYRLYEWRQILWSMVEICLTTDNSEYGEPEERANLLLRWEHLEKILEACSLLVSASDAEEVLEKKAED